MRKHIRLRLSDTIQELVCDAKVGDELLIFADGTGVVLTPAQYTVLFENTEIAKQTMAHVAPQRGNGTKRTFLPKEVRNNQLMTVLAVIKSYGGPGVTATEIRQTTKLPSKHVSNRISTLSNSGFIKKLSGRGVGDRTTTYAITNKGLTALNTRTPGKQKSLLLTGDGVHGGDSGSPA